MTCISIQNYAPGCPHYFDGWNYTKWNYVVVSIKGELVTKDVRCWPNAGMLHVFNSKNYLFPDDEVVCFIEKCDFSVNMFEKDRKNG